MIILITLITGFNKSTSSNQFYCEIYIDIKPISSGDTRQNDAADHRVPGPDQHIQHHSDQLPQGDR